MVDIKKNRSFTWGIALLFVPSILGLASLFDLIPHVWWLQLIFVLAIIGCVGIGSYLAWWGKAPRAARGEWRPSWTLPGSDEK
ncbi:hypothetical protein [Tsukamurella sp. 1534]|uniref:hypothetical protein n=1 Tax=Tsukamurella sp. 1534 TaxID=1151061 RepID=UPI00030D0DFD|nr:hypothetical protein [Tsukamurella sp. 1534]